MYRQPTKVLRKEHAAATRHNFCSHLRVCKYKMPYWWFVVFSHSAPYAHLRRLPILLVILGSKASLIAWHPWTVGGLRRAPWVSGYFSRPMMDLFHKRKLRCCVWNKNIDEYALPPVLCQSKQQSPPPTTKISTCCIPRSWPGRASSLITSQSRPDHPYMFMSVCTCYYTNNPTVNSPRDVCWEDIPGPRGKTGKQRLVCSTGQENKNWLQRSDERRSTQQIFLSTLNMSPPQDRQR